MLWPREEHEGKGCQHPKEWIPSCWHIYEARDIKYLLSAKGLSLVHCNVWHTFVVRHWRWNLTMKALKWCHANYFQTKTSIRRNIQMHTWFSMVNCSYYTVIKKNLFFFNIITSRPLKYLMCSNSCFGIYVITLTWGAWIKIFSIQSKSAECLKTWYYQVLLWGWAHHFRIYQA